VYSGCSIFPTNSFFLKKQYYFRKQPLKTEFNGAEDTQLLREVEQSLDPTGFSRRGLGCSPANRVSVAQWNELVSSLDNNLKHK